MSILAFGKISSGGEKGTAELAAIAEEDVRSESGSDTEPARSERAEEPSGVIMEGFLQKKARTRLGGCCHIRFFRLTDRELESGRVASHLASLYIYGCDDAADHFRPDHRHRTGPL